MAMTETIRLHRNNSVYLWAAPTEYLLYSVRCYGEPLVVSCERTVRIGGAW